MDEQNVFDERVRIIPISDETFSDQRGWVMNPLRAANLAGVVPRNFHLASMEPRAIRGNHAHQFATEWLLIFNGTARLTWSPMDRFLEQEAVKSITISEPMFLVIAPGTAHQIRNISERTLFLIAFNDAPEGETGTMATPFSDSE